MFRDNTHTRVDCVHPLPHELSVRIEYRIERKIEHTNT